MTRASAPAQEDFTAWLLAATGAQGPGLVRWRHTPLMLALVLCVAATGAVLARCGRGIMMVVDLISDLWPPRVQFPEDDDGPHRSSGSRGAAAGFAAHNDGGEGAADGGQAYMAYMVNRCVHGEQTHPGQPLERGQELDCSGALTAASARGTSRLFTPLQLGGLSLRNRVVKAATFEAGCDRRGVPLPCLIEHHREVAAGGTALTVVAYGAVSNDGRSFASQLLLCDEARPGLRALTAAVHAEGGAAAVQLTHAGSFSKPSLGTAAAGRPLAPSRIFNPAGFCFARAMQRADMERVASDFGGACKLLRSDPCRAAPTRSSNARFVCVRLSLQRRQRWRSSVGSMLWRCIWATATCSHNTSRRTPTAATTRHVHTRVTLTTLCYDGRANARIDASIHKAPQHCNSLNLCAC
jgi:hypothetical protein